MSANHVRAQIRALFYTRLRGVGITDAGLNVFNSRVTPYEQGQLPAINITSGGEQIERGAMGSPTPRQDRSVDMRFDVIAQAGEGTADLLDKICAQIETRIAPGAWSQSLIFDIEVTGIDEVFDGDGTAKAGQLRLIAQVHYSTNEGAPTVAAN